MKNWRVLLSSAITIILLIFEVLVLKSNKCVVNYSLVLIGMCYITFFLFYFFKKDFQNKYSLKLSLFTVLKGGIASVPGIILWIYFLIHMSWIAALLKDYYTNDTVISLDRFYVSFVFQFLPFISNTLITQLPKNVEVETKERKILVTALSLNPQKYFEECLEKVNISKSKSEIIDNMPKNWLPIIKIIEYYSNLKEIIVILSPQVDKQLTSISLAHTDIDVFNNILKTLFPERIIKYNTLLINDIDSFEGLFACLKAQIEIYFKSYNDRQIIFGLSSGTAVMTASLLFLSLPGSRGAVYHKQNTDELDHFKVDVLTIKELWDEIFVRYTVK